MCTTSAGVPGAALRLPVEPAQTTVHVDPDPNTGPCHELTAKNSDDGPGPCRELIIPAWRTGFSADDGACLTCLEARGTAAMATARSFACCCSQRPFGEAFPVDATADTTATRAITQAASPAATKPIERFCLAIERFCAIVEILPFMSASPSCLSASIGVVDLE